MTPLSQATAQFGDVLAEYAHMPQPSIVQVHRSRALSGALSRRLHFATDWDTTEQTWLLAIRDMCTWANAFSTDIDVDSSLAMTAVIDLHGVKTTLATWPGPQAIAELGDRFGISIVPESVWAPGWFLSLLTPKVIV